MIRADKAALFLEKIDKDAKERADKIKRDVDAYISSELQKTRLKAQENLKALKKSEIDRLNEVNNESFSELEALENEKLIDRRNEITDEVFKEAEVSLAEFVKSESYLPFLKRSISKILEAVGDDAVIFLRPNDEIFVSELQELCPAIEFDSDIKIGGCRARNERTHILADDTLEARLNEERESFFKYSNLSITL